MGPPPCTGHAARTTSRSVDALLDAGCDVNARIKYGSTALHVAADHGCAGCTRILIKRGADVNASNNRSDTPLHTAAYRGHLDIIQMLVQAGANHAVRNKHGLTPIEEASAKNFQSCVQYLLPYNTNIFTPSKEIYSGPFNTHQNEKTHKSKNMHLEFTHRTARGVEGNSDFHKLNVSHTPCSPVNKLSNNDILSSLSHSGGSSIDSDYSSYSSTSDISQEGFTSSFNSLLYKALTVRSLCGSPVSKAATKAERQQTPAVTGTDEVLQDAGPPELPPRPPRLCMSQTNRFIKSPVIATEKLVDMEVNQFIEKLQIRMVEMQEQLTEYMTSNKQLRHQVQILTNENKKLKAENNKIQMIRDLKQSNLYCEGLSELDEGVHSGSYLINQGHNKVTVLTSYGNGSSPRTSHRSREPEESNEFE
ncbi:hypothetical protein Btru_072691 [Bulinus truncatus]|nr:hypothetical protein Btru_072691 [Bulinus truncatus]